MSHVFVSYVREDQKLVDRLASDLTRNGVCLWLDRERIYPGMFWKDAIRKAIREGEFFLACFSQQSNRKEKTYMNEELVVAVEQIRQYQTTRLWFIPVFLEKCEVPTFNIGAGRLLSDLQWIELYADWEAGVDRILSAIVISRASKSGVSYGGTKMTGRAQEWNPRAIRIGLKTGLISRDERGGIVFSKEMIRNICNDSREAISNAKSDRIKYLWGDAAALAVVRSKVKSVTMHIDEMDLFVGTSIDPMFAHIMPIASEARIMTSDSKGRINVNDDLVDELASMITKDFEITDLDDFKWLVAFEVSVLKMCVDLIEARLLLYSSKNLQYTHLISIYLFFVLKTWGFIDKIRRVIKCQIREKTAPPNKSLQRTPLTRRR